MSSYTLLDAEEQHMLHPQSFMIPTKGTRMTFEPEGVVQVMFKNDTGNFHGPTHERMWVEITKLIEPGKYVGTLDNSPVFIRGVQYGDEIQFEARHIIKFINEDGQPDI